MAENEPVLNAVLSATQVMISQLDPEAILQVLVEKITTLDGIRASAVFEYNEELYCLQARASAGLARSHARAISIPPVGSSGGAIGRAFQTREPVLVDDIDHEPSFMPDGRRRLQRQNLQAILAVPLNGRDKLLGILAVYFPRQVSPSSVDIDSIRTLANLASLALDNARLYQAKVRASQEMETLYSQLAERSELLSRSVQIHNWLARTVLTSNGLDRTISALSELARAAAVVEDCHLNVLGASAPLEMPASPSDAQAGLGLAPFVKDPRIRGLVRHIGATGRPELVPSMPDIGLTRSRIMAPVFVGDSLLGFVSILSSDKPLDKLDYIICEQGAIAVGLEMMKRKVAYEVEQRLRGDLLENLLEGRTENLDQVAAAMAGYRCDLRTLQRALIVRLDSRDDAGGAESVADRQTLLRSLMYPVVEQTVTSAFPNSVLVGKGEGLIVLLGAETPVEDSAVAALARRVLSALAVRIAPSTASIGIGRHCGDPRELRSSFLEATKGLEVADLLRKRGTVISYADLGAYAILVRQSDPKELREFAHRYMEPLLEYDRAHDGGLVQTLSTYVRNSYRLHETARELIVHRNTVKYRLQKIEELTGSRLDDAECLMNLQLALRIHQLTA